MIIRIRLNGLYHGGAWYMRQYLNGRTCSVVAITSTGFEVEHPISKKSGCYVRFSDAEIVAGYNDKTHTREQKFHFRNI